MPFKTNRLLAPSPPLASHSALDIRMRIQTRNYGTITHQPPETLASGHVSRETDTFSLGVLLWQMYTGSRPWAGLTHSQVCACACGVGPSSI